MTWPCKIIFRSRHEQLWLWDNSKGAWHKPIRAVSGGGRGQKIPGLNVQTGYGVRNTRAETGRIANMGGLIAPALERFGKPAATMFGVIPNGTFELGPIQHKPDLGMCVPLVPRDAALMGRGHFYIHGQGHVGSEGCIVPINGQLGRVLEITRSLQRNGRVFLRVEESVTKDIPDVIPHFA